MAYSTGTYNDANCASALMAILDTALLAAGFTDVETWTSGAKVANIYKSPVASNGVADWYLSIYASAPNATNIYFMVAEDYDLTNHKLRKYIPTTGTGITVNASDNTVTDTTGLLPDGTASAFTIAIVASTTTAYYLSVTINRIIYGQRYGTTDTGFYAGLVDNMLNTTDLPYSSVAIWAGLPGYTSGKTLNYTPNQASGGFTREPGAPAAAAPNFSGPSPYATAAAWPFMSGFDGADSVYKAGYLAARQGIFSNRDASNLYVPRALFPADYIVSPRTAAVNGDTLTIGAKTYVKMSGSNVKLFVDNSV